MRVKKYTLLVLLSLFTISVGAQKLSKFRIFDSLEIARKILCCKNVKTELPDNCPTSFMVALNQYPELQYKVIHFKHTTIKTTLNCRPTFASSFKAAANRVYIIRINNSPSFEGVKMYAVPFQARIGIYGHEIAHIADYSQMNTWQLISTGLHYLYIKGKRNIEHRVEEIAFDHGFGLYIYQWTHFLYTKSGSTERYLNHKSKIYYKPKDVLIKLDKIFSEDDENLITTF